MKLVSFVILAYTGLGTLSEQPMSAWDQLSDKTKLMSGGFKFVQMFEQMYDVYGIVTQDPEYKEYKKQKALENLKLPPDEQAVEMRRHLQ